MTAVLAAMPEAPAPAAGPETVQARRVLVGYARTLSGPLAALVSMLVAWSVSGAGGWAAAAGAAAGWALLAGAWLRRCGWSAPRVHALSWGAPLALLAPLIAAGWLTPDGLVLWAPLAGMCAVALMITHRPAVPLRDRTSPI